MFDKLYLEFGGKIYDDFHASRVLPGFQPDIKIKLLDTIFRELYTPYGIRVFAKTSARADGLVYPKYMAYFIEANLNQNGRSYASKKIAYNLVKELFLDIGKYVKDSVIYAYSEKGISIDSKVLDLYTISEMIRLYTMFM